MPRRRYSCEPPTTTLFTELHDRHIIQFLAIHNPGLEGRCGSLLWKRLVNAFPQDNDKRTAQVWMYRYHCFKEYYDQKVDDYLRLGYHPEQQIPSSRSIHHTVTLIDCGAFTDEDEQFLISFLSINDPTGKQRRSNGIYFTLAENFLNHSPKSAQLEPDSWRKHYWKFRDYYDCKIQEYQKANGLAVTPGSVTSLKGVKRPQILPSSSSTSRNSDTTTIGRLQQITHGNSPPENQDDDEEHLNHHDDPEQFDAIQPSAFSTVDGECELSHVRSGSSSGVGRRSEFTLPTPTSSRHEQHSPAQKTTLTSFDKYLSWINTMRGEVQMYTVDGDMIVVRPQVSGDEKAQSKHRNSEGGCEGKTATEDVIKEEDHPDAETLKSPTEDNELLGADPDNMIEKLDSNSSRDNNNISDSELGLDMDFKDDLYVDSPMGSPLHTSTPQTYSPLYIPDQIGPRSSPSEFSWAIPAGGVSRQAVPPVSGGDASIVSEHEGIHTSDSRARGAPSQQRSVSVQTISFLRSSVTESSAQGDLALPLPPPASSLVTPASPTPNPVPLNSRVREPLRPIQIESAFTPVITRSSTCINKKDNETITSPNNPLNNENNDSGSQDSVSLNGTTTPDPSLIME
ncbi:hypothetical protein K435DRAFT_850997, partial [Dendrothele bispora CBS 962.96]